MLLKNVLDRVRKKTAAFQGQNYQGFLAVQITLTDLEEVFYVEIKNGVLSIEPYSYDDRQANLIVSSDNFAKLVAQKLDPVVAFTTGKLKVEGDVGKALELAELFKE
jgi:putative sterol carrier protein